MKNSRKKTIALTFLAIILGGIIALSTFIMMSPKKEPSEVLSETSPTNTPVPSNESQKKPVLSPSETNAPKEITIALFGDSMIDTMGDKADVLAQVLKRKYPDTIFTIYNYGIGAQNVEAGLARFDSPYVYFKRDYPPVASVNPDIVIVGTFSYNPFNPHDPGRHIEALTNLLQKAKQTGADVYLLVEIAPLSEDFGRGEKGVNMTTQAAADHASHIRENLEDSLNVARSVGITAIDAYTGSKINETTGTKTYVNPDDGIHPSYEGHLYTADQIVKTIKLN